MVGDVALFLDGKQDKLLTQMRGEMEAAVQSKPAPQKQQQNASLKQGVDVIRAELHRIGLTEKDFNIINPSGFTLENRLSATGS